MDVESSVAGPSSLFQQEMELQPPFRTTDNQSPAASCVSSASDSGEFAHPQLNNIGFGLQLGQGQHPYNNNNNNNNNNAPQVTTGVHPNLFVRGIPLHFTEDQLVGVFSQYGELSSLRLVKHSVRKTSLGYGFVRYRNAQDAAAAIDALHGQMLDGQVLQVKLADSDAGPPSTSSVSGLTPCDTLYIKHIPLTFTKQHLELLFGQFGAVVDVKEFPCLDQFRGSSALVKMDTVPNAMEAIKHVHGMKPAGWLHNIIVRFAESEKEKKERLTRKEQQQLKRGPSGTLSNADLSSGRLSNPDLSSGGNGLRNPPPLSSGGSPSVLAAPTAPGHYPLSIQNGLPNASHGNQSQTVPHVAAAQPATTTDMLTNAALAALRGTPGAYTQQPQPQLQQLQKVLVHNVPPIADRLWMFENFARFGGILSLSLDRRARVATIVFGEHAAAMRAVFEMNQQGGLFVKIA